MANQSMFPADAFTVLPPARARQVTDRYYAQRTAPFRFSAPDAAAWLARAATVRQGVRAALALDPLPDRCPLDVHQAGVLERPGYNITRLYWQVLPDVYASGYLYRPVQMRGRRPAVLCPHGHWPGGLRDPIVQARCAFFALEGYIVLGVDSTHAYDYAIGASPVSLMTWANIRALDLLCERADVDPARIGATGASGGGQQTFYLMAVDERLAVAAPVCMVSFMKHILTNDHVAHCWCNHVPGILAVADTPEIAATFAPKPAFYISVSGDWTAGFSDEEYPEIRRAYGMLDAADRVAERRWDCGHDYNRQMREAVVRWFNRWLRGDDRPVREPAFPIEPEQTLLTLNSAPPRAGVIWGSPGPSSDPALNRAVAHHFRRRLAAASNVPRDTLRARLRAFLGEDQHSPAAAATVCERIERQGARILQLTCESEPGIVIPALLVEPIGVNRGEMVCTLVPQGKKALFVKSRPAAWLGQQLADGRRVLAPDVRFRGELANVWPGPGVAGQSLVDDPDAERPAITWNSMAFGRPESVLAVRDVRAVLDATAHLRAPSETVVLVASGPLALPALLAAAIDERITHVQAALPRSDPFRDWDGAPPGNDGLPIVPGLLRVMCWHDLLSLVRLDATEPF